MRKPVQTEEEAMELWNKNSKERMFHLNRGLVRLAWLFCQMSLENFMDAMGHPLNPEDEERIVNKECECLIETINMPPFRRLLLKEADRTYMERIMKWANK